jgi:DNA-binding transcriptional regulator PaaX
VDRNQLKIPILQLFFTDGPMESASLLRRLAQAKSIVIDIHALRMALMRYYKQGLLKRERSGGTFIYLISEKGTSRLNWLEQHRTNTHS